jgi:hypothetical protein
MKRILILVVLTLNAALAASAGPSGFVKVGGRYQVRLGNESTDVTVRADGGDGWFYCQLMTNNASLYINFNQATYVMAANGAVGQTMPLSPDDVRKKILNNLRQLSAASDMYYLENNASQARLADLVGPTKYVKQIIPVDGEDYSAIVFKQGVALVVHTKSGIEVSYAP